jgi:polyhydroxybutyrate depolymerase
MNFFKAALLHTSLACAALVSSIAPAHASSGVVGGNVKLTPTSGTTSFYQGVSWQGTTRSVLFIRPTTLPAGKSAAIVMLHYQTGTPELQANVAQAGKLAAKMGYWVILPPAIGGKWNDNPADKSNTTDDVGFLKTLISTATQQYPIDATRVSMAGLSSGAFMTIRFACEQPNLIASGFAVAAEMLTTMSKACAPSRPVPMTLVMGTKDPIVAYNGNASYVSAPKSFGTWAGYSACNTNQTTTQNFKPSVNDGTTITFQHNAVCSSLGEADLYTVNNGGHAWPGGSSFGVFGIVSQNLDATTTLGNFAKLWTTKSTV